MSNNSKIDEMVDALIKTHGETYALHYLTGFTSSLIDFYIPKNGNVTLVDDLINYHINSIKKEIKH